jgi:hypothetical protein
VKHWYVKVAGAVCIAGILTLVVTLLPTASARESARSTHQLASKNVPKSVRRTTKAAVLKEGNPSSLVATLTETAPDFATPGGPQTGTVPATWYGAPSALPVLAQDNGYLEVRLAQRPNGSTAWIASSAATLSSTPYRIVVDLATEHLKLYKAGHLLMNAPAGIGTVQDPTPTGNFFVVLFAAPPSCGLGAIRHGDLGSLQCDQRLRRVGGCHCRHSWSSRRRRRHRRNRSPCFSRLRAPA